MSGINPVTVQGAAASATNSSNQPAPSNQLNANSFITLLTTQLQAQSPLNPLDPTQMVSELTMMNNLQQLIQIREDMDALVSAAKSPQGGAATPQTAARASSSQQSTNANTLAQAASTIASAFLPSSDASLFSQVNSNTLL